jgi:hypothetical protein
LAAGKTDLKTEGRSGFCERNASLDRGDEPCRAQQAVMAGAAVALMFTPMLGGLAHLPIREETADLRPPQYPGDKMVTHDRRRIGPEPIQM